MGRDMEGKVILVAVDASKEVAGHALEWAALNVARASDSLVLLALLPSRARSHPKSSQFFARLLKKLRIGRRKEDDGAFDRANNVCLNIMQRLCSAHDLTQVKTEVKVVDFRLGSVASKAKEVQANWVILDRHLRRESEYCLKQLKCNIVLVDHTIPKILKSVNLSSKPIQTKLRLSIKPISNFVAAKSHPKLLANPLYDKRSYAAESSKTRTDSSSTMMNRTSSVRKAMSLYTKQPPNPPPLCSVCNHNAPVFGKAPREFGFEELARATDRFSRDNLLVVGGFGAVHRGVLPDGQVIAVKQHRVSSVGGGASEFRSEVEVLSCAQHRNVVMLVGYCTEIEWLLVYEFSCNGSLDKHLYGKEKKELMSWKNRMKVAIGAARGLRYLHEDCRVGCIIHTDFRPNNILLTHDFEPLVGDFGLARLQVDGQSAEETRGGIGALGYLAPEYTESRVITEKTNVYAFGVVLLELLSGFNVTEFWRKTGQRFVSEWGGPLLERMSLDEIIEPRLENNYVKKEVECMMIAARLCISPNPDQRPRMSKVLKILERDVLVNTCSSQNTSLSEKPSADGGDKERKTNTPLGLSKQNEMPSEERQAHLHVSLAKFFQNLN